MNDEPKNRILFHVIEDLKNSADSDNIEQIMESTKKACDSILLYIYDNGADVSAYKGVSIYTEKGEKNIVVPAIIITGKDVAIMDGYCSDFVILNKENSCSFNQSISLAKKDFSEVVKKAIKICDKYMTLFFSQVIIFEKDEVIKILVKSETEGQKLAFDFLKTRFL